MINELCDMFSLSFIIKIVYNPFTRNEVLTLSSFLFLVNWIDKHKKKKLQSYGIAYNKRYPKHQAWSIQ